MDSALVLTPRISAFLCASAVNMLYPPFTAETQRNAEIRREKTSNILQRCALTVA